MNWNTYFINMIDVIKIKSKDTSTKVGCVIVDEQNSIRSTGFNGLPRGVNDSVASRFERPEKYMWTEHSERNAIFNAARIGVSLEGCKIYQGWIPCCDCARGIIQAGIKEVIIDGRNFQETDKYWNERWKDSMNVSRQMLKEAGVKLTVCGRDGSLTDYYDMLNGEERWD